VAKIDAPTAIEEIRGKQDEEDADDDDDDDVE